MPKAFRGTDGGWNGDQDAVFKSWYDGRQRITALEAENASLKRTSNAGVPASASEYVDTYDFDALERRAPRMYAGGGRDNPVVADLLKLGHTHGVPVAKMQALATDYFAGMDPHLEEPKDEATLRKEAIAHLGPNGQTIYEDLKGKLTAYARTRPLSETAQAVAKQMLLSGPAAAFLYEVMSAATANGAAPPSHAEAQALVDPEQERREAHKGLGVLDDAEWRANKDALIARWLRAHPEQAA